MQKNRKNQVNGTKDMIKLIKISKKIGFLPLATHKQKFSEI